MKRFLLAAAFLLLTALHAQADTIAYTSFEEPGLGGKYTDTGDADTSHALSNNSGEAIVTYAFTGGELGFSSYYTTTGGSGLTDADYVGVTDYTPVYGGSFTDGTQGFEIQDTDGIMTVTLDTVDLTGYGDASVSLDMFFKETGWESTDASRVWVTVDGGIEIDLLNTAGSDIDDLNIEDAWKTYTADLSGYTTAQLSFLLESNSADETIWVDNVVFEGSPVPVPGAIILLGSGLIGLAGIRRKDS